MIEGTASYGAILAGTVATHGFPVAEGPRMDAKKNRGIGQKRFLGCSPNCYGSAAATGGLTANSTSE